MSTLFYILLAVFLFVCLFLTLLILIQKGRGGGLASAFGGGGGNTAFGSKTGDVLTWATSIVFGIFLLLAVILNLLANRVHAKSSAALTGAAAAAVEAGESSPTPNPEQAPGGTMVPPPGVERDTAGGPRESLPPTPAVPAPSPSTQPSTQPQ
jgi:preprotein translocase subunit SecG